MIRSIKIGDLDFYQDDSNVTGKVQLANGINYERHIVNELRRFIPTSIGFADIGANAGIHTIIAKSIKRTLPVVCAEASPSNVTLLLNNILHNGLTDIRVLPFPITDAHKIIGINRCFDNSHCSVHIDQEHDIPCVAFSLNDILLPSVDLVKLDVEGMELLVLEGASAMMASRPRVIFEYCPKYIALSGRDHSELIQYFFDSRYKLTILDYKPGMRQECFSVHDISNRMALFQTEICDILAGPR